MSTRTTPEERAVLDLGALMEQHAASFVILRTLDGLEAFELRAQCEAAANPASSRPGIGHPRRVRITAHDLPDEELKRGLRFYEETDEKHLGCRVWREIHPCDWRL